MSWLIGFDTTLGGQKNSYDKNADYIIHAIIGLKAAYCVWKQKAFVKRCKFPLIFRPEIACIKLGKMDLKNVGD